jgi:hypothetical protein
LKTSVTSFGKYDKIFVTVIASKHKSCWRTGDLIDEVSSFACLRIFPNPNIQPQKAFYGHRMSEHSPLILDE